MNYIVMECHSSYAVLLDEEGRFLKAANLHYEVGQTVYDPVLMREKPEKGFRPVRWVTGGAAAIAACFLMLFGVNYYQNHMASYSSIYLTINPEVQMTLNRQGEVLKLQGTNEDGRTLLEGYDGKGKDKVTVTDELIDRAIEMGFLSEGGLVSFSIDAPEEAVLQEYSKELESEVKRYLKNRLSITIEIIDRQTGDTETSTTEDPAQSQENSNEPVQETQQQTQPAEPEVYEDTDYGLENDGVTDNSETPPQPQVPQISEEEESDYDSSSDYGDSAYEGEDD
ncbi:MAG TPA: hypothetical protein H9935_13800 [Candidatus Blautia merdigallinarum]|uniref:Anti-sigma factor RsgI-like middle domain-containing protein n=1 Tax=Candidatus Blautia merdigallinarum TaxID=2838495 RepID=A0A9D2N8D2_9FIRM|nr:hypothetical protein [Candidatus Blautia merdigallinarum]